MADTDAKNEQQFPDHDLLIRIDQKLSDLCSDFSKVSNGVGFPRCADRGARITILEKQLVWLKRSMLGVLFTAVVGALKHFFF